MWGYTSRERNAVVECGLNVRMEWNEMERLNLFDLSENRMENMWLWLDMHLKSMQMSSKLVFFIENLKINLKLFFFQA